MFESFIPEKKKDKGNLMVFLVSSILVTLFLFYIDEGNYNFEWTESILSFFVALIYILPMFLLQWIVYKLLPNKLSKTDKYLTSIPSGIVLGTILVIGGFYLLG